MVLCCPDPTFAFCSPLSSSQPQQRWQHIDLLGSSPPSALLCISDEFSEPLQEEFQHFRQQVHCGRCTNPVRCSCGAASNSTSFRNRRAPPPLAG